MKKLVSFIGGQKLNITKVGLTAFFICMVIIPLLRMLFHLDADTFQSIVNAKDFGTIVGNSLWATSIATTVTLVLAYVLAISVERTNIRFKEIISIILVLPMLIPSISHGMSLVVLFGNNGILTRLFQLDGNIYGLKGIVIGSVLYAFPVAYLMFRDVLKYQDGTPYQAAKVLGIPKWRQFVAITFPYLRKPLISITLATFTMIITDYGVPLMIGGKYKTIPSVLYQEVIGRLNFSKGSFYGLLLLVPAVIGFLFDFLNKDKGNSGYVTHPMSIRKNGIRDGFAYLFCGMVSIFTMMPIAVFSILALAKRYPKDLSFTFSNIEKTLQMKAGTYLVNSIQIAIFVALIGVVLAFLTAYLTARLHGKTSKVLHLFAITSAAIPGVVLGLSYILTFKGTFIYGTLAILIMVNIIHFIASPYLMIYNSLSKLNENLEDVGLTLGISRFRIIKDVIIPQSIFSIIEMFSYFFVNSMMTISAVAFLSTTANKPVALMINQFEAQMQLESAAVVSISILLINLLIKGTIHFLKKLIVKTKSNLQEEELVA